MRVLRGLGGSVLWILAGVLGLVGVLLSATLILLPLGIPVLMLARRLFRYSMRLFLPREVRHPVQETGKSVRRGAKDASSAVAGATPDTKAFRKAGKQARKKVRNKARKRKSLLDRLADAV